MSITELCKQLTDAQIERIKNDIARTNAFLDRMEETVPILDDKAPHRVGSDDERETGIRESLCRQILAAVDHSDPKVRDQAMRTMLDVTSNAALRHLAAALLSPHNESDHTHLAVLEICAQLGEVVGHIRDAGFETFEGWCK